MPIQIEKEKWSDFKEKILPNLEALLHFALGLTVNGRDAVDLLRDALAEAYRSWNKLPAEEECGTQIQEIMTRRFLGGLWQHVRPPVPTADGQEKFIERNRLIPEGIGDPRRKPSLSSDTEYDGEYSDAIAGLPEAFRSAMILSYLEGFSSSEIAGLAGVPPHEIDALLKRGREIIRDELFAYLMGNGESEVHGAETAMGG